MAIEKNESNQSGTSHGRGFFQLCRSRLQSIAERQLGPDAMAAYIVLAGGVNGNEKSVIRGSTHSTNSVHMRTMLSRTPVAERAIAVLCREGFLAESPDQHYATPDDMKREDMVRWLVDPEESCDLAVAQGFLQPRDPKKPVNKQTIKGSLAHLCREVRNGENIPTANAIVDALLMFFFLHANQDFDKFAGVDPKLISGKFNPIDVDEDGDGTRHLMKVSHVDGWTLVSEREPCKLEIASELAMQALGCVPIWDDAPSVEARAAHAIQQLKKAGLLYSAHVLWDADPTRPPKGRFPEPSATLYVNDKSTTDLQQHLQRDVHEAIFKTCTQDPVDVFGESRGVEARWVGSGIYRYMVPTHQVGKVVLLSQLRVRWWPLNGATRTGLEIDQERVMQWRLKLQGLIKTAELAMQGSEV